MYDRPTIEEMIDAVRVHLEQNVIPAIKNDHRLYFQTLVAINVLKISERELNLRDKHLRAEWQRLNDLHNATIPFPTDIKIAQIELARRNEILCELIRSGQINMNQALFEHLKATSIEQLEVANPKYLYTLAQEEQ